MALRKFCPGCGKIIDMAEGQCSGCKDKKNIRDHRQYDRRRESSTKRGYDDRWRKYRINYLKQNPICVECFDRGLIKPATVVDHIEPHKGDMYLFWNTKNHQALCKKCHDRKTASEDGGFGNNCMGRGE